MRNVVLFSGSFHPREGGAERQMKAVLSALKADAYSVAVVTQAIPTGDVPRREVIDGIEVFRVGSRWMFGMVPRLGQVMFVAAAVWTGVRLRPRVAVSMQMGTASVAAALVARLVGGRRILRLTGGGTAKFRSEPMARAATRGGRWLASVVCSGRFTVVAPARHLIDDFEASFPDKAERALVIPNGVSVSGQAVSPVADVVWYSRAGSERSYEVFRDIAELLPEVRFTVMGHLDRDDELPVNVSSIGWTDTPEAVIRSHRVILNTSLNEGMPNTVLQAISGGVLAVGFENRGMLELGRDHADFVVTVPYGDAVRAAQAIEVALQREVPKVGASVPSLEVVQARWKAELTRGSSE